MKQTLERYAGIIGLALLFLIVAVSVARAQEVNLRLGAAFEPASTPRGLGEVSFLLGGETRSITTIQIRPITATNITTSVVTGAEKTLFKLSKADFGVCGQAGIAANAANTSGIVSGCVYGKFDLPRNLSLVATGRAENAPISGGVWDSRASIAINWRLGAVQ